MFQAIIWTNAAIFLTNFSEYVTEIRAFSSNQMLVKMPSAKWRPFCLGVNVLICESFKQVGGVIIIQCVDFSDMEIYDIT